MPEPTIDFRGFAHAAAAAAKPDYADVLARAERRRRRRGWFGASFVALAVAIGGGTFALTADRAPKPVRPAPIAEVQPWRTVVPPGATAPKPQPEYIEIKPGFWDVSERDVPLTGMYPEIKAGDLDHLYMNYQDCRAKPCKPMLAASSDRGRTWRKLSLPEQDRPRFRQPSVVQIFGTMVLAMSGWEPKDGETYNPDLIPDPDYWVSTDTGATWRQAKVREADALPLGRPVFQGYYGDAAVDPATGDVVHLKGDNRGQPMFIDTLPSNGLWRIVAADRRRVAASVSMDGGRTWENRLLPELPPAAKDAPSDRYELYTTDGRAVYFVERLRAGIRLYASGDSARTWSGPVEIGLKGRVLSVLPIDDRTVIVEGVMDTFRSTDRGRTFTRVGPSLGARGHAIPGGGFIIPTNNNEYSAWISEDGAEWTYVNHPEVP
ncbi:sialidase family protein [Actinoplanes sp. NBRC 103695]|uniref:sialidase family protein n=1 Tax=Actinoplanes sp. NBRC 103695 TaxID=3032202 RepID=UPI0024A2922C|nr:sialidase family protein [Actinoplanes sp. NBRC 103695]GLY99370.1 hypothetical protein Acsp02_66230 [Actinoplanes sp. NBRC 103695]